MLQDEHSFEQILYDIATHEIHIRGGPINMEGRFSDLFLGYHSTVGKVALKRLRWVEATKRDIKVCVEILILVG